MDCEPNSTRSRETESGANSALICEMSYAFQFISQMCRKKASNVKSRWSSNQGAYHLQKNIRLDISGINIKQLNATLREREPL